jgi:agmatinase
VGPLDELALLLRPAAGGIYLVSTGRDAQLAVQKRLYGASTDAEVQAKFREALARIADARVVVLGVPSDVGAGFRRGANLAPQAMRGALLDADPDWPARAAAHGVVDIGDVFVVPQLLHDGMCSAAQLDATRRAIYPALGDAERATLPASPLSIAERALDLVLQLNPRAAPVILGGDHSVAWPAVAALARGRTERWGIVQPDAHTDLLSERLGVKYCFATWSYHANELLGRDGRLVQVGIRASRHDRGHWEKGHGVRQFWASECRANARATIDAIVAHLKGLGVESVYFSNDIDGTDARWADATGTPEPDGLEPDFVVELVRRLGKEIGLVGGDVVEVAPDLATDGSKRTLNLAVRYLRETIGAIVGATV